MLRSWRAEDERRYNQACNTPSVMRWLGGVQSRFELKRDVEYFITSERDDGFTFWVVESLADAKFLGFCGLVRIADPDCPLFGEIEIGWRLRENCWRQGYGFEAASAVLQHAFDRADMTRVVSRAAHGNVPSQKLMMKLGLSRSPRSDYVPAGEAAKLLPPQLQKVVKRACARLPAKRYSGAAAFRDALESLAVLRDWERVGPDRWECSYAGGIEEISIRAKGAGFEVDYWRKSRRKRALHKNGLTQPEAFNYVYELIAASTFV